MKKIRISLPPPPSGFSVARSECVVRQCERTTERKNFLLEILERSSSKTNTLEKIQDKTINKSEYARTSHFAKKFAFTLAEVMITLAIIGVVAAITIPGVVINTNQAEYKTGLRKAVSALNQAINVNKALMGENPYNNEDLFNFLRQNMAIMTTVPNLYTDSYMAYTCKNNTAGGTCDNNDNAAFYTTDGMRYEFAAHTSKTQWSPKLWESDVYPCSATVGADVVGDRDNFVTCGGCGSYGLANNPDKTTLPPCLIMVDVNGDRKPTPGNVNCNDSTCAKTNLYKYADPNGVLMTDIFSIIITDTAAIPYGIVAQKAMYQAQK